MNYIHIRRFIDRLQGFDQRQSKDFICPLKDAKDLHADITRLLLDLEQCGDTAVRSEVINVEVQGGSF